MCLFPLETVEQDMNSMMSFLQAIEKWSNKFSIEILLKKAGINGMK
jgi:hypothetical protein